MDDEQSSPLRKRKEATVIRKFKQPLAVKMHVIFVFLSSSTNSRTKRLVNNRYNMVMGLLLGCLNWFPMAW